LLVAVLVVAWPVTGCSKKGRAEVKLSSRDGEGSDGSRGGEEGWDENDERRHDGRAVEGHAGGVLPVATLPGFHMLKNGRSRVFVEVNGRVDVVERREPWRLHYLLRNTVVPERVNRMDLPTDHFVTPVARVRLVQVANDAELVIELRNPSAARTRVNRSAKGTVVSVDFPAPE
jgi:hypothetical protein